MELPGSNPRGPNPRLYGRPVTPLLKPPASRRLRHRNSAFLAPPFMLFCAAAASLQHCSHAFTAPRTSVVVCRDPTYKPQVSSWVPIFTLMWFSTEAFVYETPYGGAERSPAGRSVVRLSTLAQCVAFGKKLEASAPSVTYSIYKMENSNMRLKGTYPKTVNAEDARIRFRKRQPRLGGANDETVLGVGGMGDDIWRELVTKDNWDSVDDAWAAFRKQLELGREIEVVDENGERIQFGD